MNQELIESYRLLRVNYGDESGLCSLVTGDLLAASLGELHAPSNLAKVSMEDWQVEKWLGEEHNWTGLIGLLQRHYDWDTKSLPDELPIWNEH